MIFRLFAAILIVSMFFSASAHAEGVQERLAKMLVDKLKDVHIPEQTLVDPENEYHFAGVKNVRHIAALTGEDSVNETLSRYGLGGTDLGYMVNLGDKTFFVFGDSHFAHSQSADYKHNAIAYTTDRDYTDGIVLDGMLMTGDGGRFREIISTGLSGVKGETTCIPGGAFILGDAFYISYFSRSADDGSRWNFNFSSYYKSTDGGETFARVDSLAWPKESLFMQQCPQVIGDMVYILGTGGHSGGRGDPVVIARVPADSFEDMTAYAYMTAYDEHGGPVWEKGEEAMLRAKRIILNGGELSAMYSAYLGEWLVVNKTRAGNINISAAKEIWGPYSRAVPIAPQGTFWKDGYGPNFNPLWVSHDGATIGFTMSVWWPVYNVHIMELTLMRK